MGHFQERGKGFLEEGTLGGTLGKEPTALRLDSLLFWACAASRAPLAMVVQWPGVSPWSPWSPWPGFAATQAPGPYGSLRTCQGNTPAAFLQLCSPHVGVGTCGHRPGRPTSSPPPVPRLPRGKGGPHGGDGNCSHAPPHSDLLSPPALSEDPPRQPPGHQVPSVSPDICDVSSWFLDKLP